MTGTLWVCSGLPGSHLSLSPPATDVTEFHLPFAILQPSEPPHLLPVKCEPHLEQRAAYFLLGSVFLFLLRRDCFALNSLRSPGCLKLALIALPQPPKCWHGRRAHLENRTVHRLHPSPLQPFPNSRSHRCPVEFQARQPARPVLFSSHNFSLWALVKMYKCPSNLNAWPVTGRPSRGFLLAVRGGEKRARVCETFIDHWAVQEK